MTVASPASRTARPPGPEPDLRRIAGRTLVRCCVLSAVARGVTETFAVFLLPLSGSFGWDRAEASSIYGVAMLSFGSDRWISM